MKLRKLAIALTAPILLVSSCGKVEEAAKEVAGSVVIRDVKYDPVAKKITWRIVTKGLAVVTSYVVSINGVEKTIQYNGSASGSMSYDAQGAAFDFSIMCNDNLDKHATYSTTFDCLPTVTNLEFHSDAVTWDAIDGIDEYLVMNNNKETVVTTASFPINPGQFNVKVKPYKSGGVDANGNESFFSYWSESFSGTLLNAPGGLEFDSEKITWNAVVGATAYELDVNGTKFSVTQTQYPFTGRSEDLVMAVRALGNEGSHIFGSKWTQNQEYKYIQPVELRVDDGIVVFDEPAGATRYKYKLNDIVQSDYLTKNEYTNLIAGVPTKISVLPCGPDDHSYSTWSTPLTATILPSPSVRWQGNNIIWDTVTGAGGYGISIVGPDGKEFKDTVGRDTFTYPYPFSDVGEYVVKVKANGTTGSNYYDSRYSAELRFNRLPKPGTYSIENNVLGVSQFVIKTAAVNGANEYALFANGSEIMRKMTPEFAVDVSALGERQDELDINFEVQAIGTTNNTPIYLDSLEKTQISATRLATPKNVIVSGNTITWDSVPNAEGYVITLDEDSNRFYANGTSYDLKLLAAGTHKITIQAYNSSVNYIVSQPTPEKSIKKLTAPTPTIQKYGASVETQKFWVTWEEIEGAESYRVLVGNNVYTADTNYFGLQGYEDRFTAGIAQQLAVQAIGDGVNNIDGDVSATLAIIRHSTPTNLGINGASLTWQGGAVGSIVPSQYTLKLDGQDINVQGTSYSLEAIEAGDHKAQVRTHGLYEDGTIDSPWTTEFRFAKLATPSNIVKSGTSLSWDAVPNCTTYEVRVSNSAVPIQVKTNTVDLANYLKTAGQIEVQITALGDNERYVSSSTYRETITIRALNTLAWADSEAACRETVNTIYGKTNDADHRFIDMVVHGNGNETGIKATSASATKYEAGISTAENGIYTFQINKQSADPDIPYSIRVKLIGGAFGADGVFYIDGNDSAPKGL